MCECKIAPSLSSGNLVAVVNKSVSAATNPKEVKQQRKVRFSAKATTTLSIPSRPDNDKESWLDPKLIKRNKKLCAQQGKEWQAKGYGRLLENVFSNPSRDNLDLFVQLPGTDYARGMENYLSEKLKKERYLQRNRLVQAVIDREIELKSQFIHSPDQIAQELAVISLNHSNSARDFAKRLGMADELAYRLGEHPDLVHRFGNRNISRYIAILPPRKVFGSMLERIGLLWILSSIAIVAVMVGGHHP